MRIVSFKRNYVIYPAGSCLVSFGNTKVICTATIEQDIPPFLKGKEQGWLTAEYAMLPGSTGGSRKKRELLKRDGRCTEIQRLIGRSLRAAVDLKKLGEVTIIIDCDVIQADGGTRTAAISGGWVALYDALGVLAREQGKTGARDYLLGQVGAVSVGIVDGEIICDLDYAGDSMAKVDMNVVKREKSFVEIQGAGEKGLFDRRQLLEMLDEAEKGIDIIYRAQLKSLGE